MYRNITGRDVIVVEDTKYPVDKLLLATTGLRALMAQLSDEDLSAFLQFAVDTPEAVQTLKRDTYILVADQRDRIIFGEGYNEDRYRSGLRYFKKLGRGQIRELLEEHIFNPYPWTKYMEFVWFMERDAEVYFHGFVRSPARKEEWGRENGISIEGIYRNIPFTDKKSEETFKFLFKDANQFSLEPPYAWYD